MTKTCHSEGERSLRGHFKGAFVTRGIIYQAKQASLNRLKLNNLRSQELTVDSFLKKVLDDHEGSEVDRKELIPDGTCPWRPFVHRAAYYLLAALPLCLQDCVCFCQYLPPPPLLQCLPGKKWTELNLSRAMMHTRMWPAMAPEGVVLMSLPLKDDGQQTDNIKYR